MKHQIRSCWIFSTRTSRQSDFQRSVIAGTNLANELIRAHQRAEIELEQLKERWKVLKEQVDQMGYQLQLLQKGKGTLCVALHRVNANGESNELAFCHLCDQVAGRCFAERFWCDDCLRQFLQEAFV